MLISQLNSDDSKIHEDFKKPIKGYFENTASRSDEVRIPNLMLDGFPKK
eukprot:CAMPEP_0170513196 /NCGR_PEP_ID=MMETSP0208-20121228/67272_1 /TAXON_ID=197538 /ORGANISM="Strombidium inclinatum, Strain S3" /LENGTH=48 /DNA_ID= /DNA_START= /DNA_END= /DNA_ORIENTATION=